MIARSGRHIVVAAGRRLSTDVGNRRHPATRVCLSALTESRTEGRQRTGPATTCPCGVRVEFSPPHARCPTVSANTPPPTHRPLTHRPFINTPPSGREERHVPD